MDLTFVAHNLDEAIDMAWRNPNRQVHFPGGAITLADELPQSVVEQIRQDLKADPELQR